jgi:hypothetical protein
MSSSDPVILDDRAVGEKFYRVANECHQTFFSSPDRILYSISILPKLTVFGFSKTFGMTAHVLFFHSRIRHEAEVDCVWRPWMGDFV